MLHGMDEIKIVKNPDGFLIYNLRLTDNICRLLSQREREVAFMGLNNPVLGGWHQP